MTKPIATNTASADSADKVHAAICRWLERAVIGLNLCPFAKAVYQKQQVRIVISDASTESALLHQLGEELLHLHSTPAAEIDTTLLVHPQVLQEFADYNAFLDDAEALLTQLDLDGEIQIASFHPQYQFAGTTADAEENLTNRAPYPILHLLREQSIERAVAAYPDPDVIIRRNISRVQQLGHSGWKALLALPQEQNAE